MEDNPKVKVSQGIINDIVGMIRDGHWKAGDRLPSERELTKQWSVSRASLREALAALELVGIIEARRGEGSFVSRPQVARFLNAISPLFLQNDKFEEDLLDFRSLLEREALLLAAGKESRDTAAMRACLSDMRRALDEGDTAAFIQADICFHKEMIALSGNHLLVIAYECARTLMGESVRFNVDKILKSGANGESLYRQHCGICDNLEAGLRQDALDLLARHLDFVRNV